MVQLSKAFHLLKTFWFSLALMVEIVSKSIFILRKAEPAHLKTRESSPVHHDLEKGGMTPGLRDQLLRTHPISSTILGVWSLCCQVPPALTTKNLKGIQSSDLEGCEKQEKLLGIGCFQVFNGVAQQLNWRIINHLSLVFCCNTI